MLSSSWPQQRKKSSYYQWHKYLPLIGEIARRAEGLGVAWGAWSQEGKHYAVFSGSTENYDQSSSKDYLNKLANLQKKQADNEALSSLPWLIVLRRFNGYQQHRQRNHSLPKIDHVWQGWGDLGTVWYPSIALCYDESKQTGYLSWLDEQQDRALINALFFDLILKQYVSPLFDSHDNPTKTSEMKTLLEAQEDFPSWSSRIQQVKTLCHQQKLDKAVLARSWVKTAAPGTQWSGAKLFQKLLDKAQTNEIPFAFSVSPEVTFVGLSPEKLFSLNQGLVQSHALAGTRIFKEDMSETDQENLISELVSADKDQQEHQIVVDQIQKRLSPWCDQLVIDQRRIKQLRHLVHLETKLSGQIKPEINVFQLLETLHPTPALGGSPRDSALSLIDEQEPLHRGGYAAPWLWGNCKKEMTAVVGIRSALIHPDKAYVFAGAGIVSESVPELEWEETQAKAKVISALLNEEVCISTSHVNYTKAQQASLAQSSLQRCLTMVNQMIASGLHGAVISPGSRNTPLALALQQLLPCEICVDERSAAFVALGWAKSSNAPVALCCTSGSAGAHYLPALIEAWHSAIPMIIMTADRPPRLRNRGAAQTIQQVNLYGHYAEQSFDLPVETLQARPYARLALSEIWKSLGQIAIEQTLEAPCSPVHLNIPFEEPLWDEGCDTLLESLAGDQTKTPTPSIEKSPKSHKLPLQDQSIHQELINDFKAALLMERGLVYCGPLSPHDAKQIKVILAQISQLSSWSIVTESSSQFRSETWALSSFDALARSQSSCSHLLPQPEHCDCLLMIGGGPHSRAVRAWLKRTQPKAAYYLGSGPDTVDPDEKGLLRLGSTLPAGLAIIQSALNNIKALRCIGDVLKSSHWPQRWSTIENHWHAYTESFETSKYFPKNNDGNSSLWGGSIVNTLVKHLQQLESTDEHNQSADHPQTQSTDLIVASSMAFRDHDMLWLSQYPSCYLQSNIWVNRGANGIDGTFSTALGVAKGTHSSAPLVVYLGDLASYHDIQGLHKLAQWHHHNQSPRPLLVIMVNNDGGGIFQHLPIRQTKSFENLFQTSLSVSPKNTVDWISIARSFSWNCFQAQSQQELSAHLGEALNGKQPSFIEVIINPQFDLKCHQEFWLGFSESMDRHLTGDKS